jgi:hypothetical protein
MQDTTIKPSHPPSKLTGKGVRVAIIDTGVNPSHPHVGAVAGGIRVAPTGVDPTGDYLDYHGHGTAVAGAIREKAPDAWLYAVKVLDRALITNIEAIARAVEWAISENFDVINVSLGTTNVDHRTIFEHLASRAVERRIVIVAAYEQEGKLSLPGSLPHVVGVAADSDCPRDTYRVEPIEGGPVFKASPYPRDIPGVPRERNLNGVSFAVANMSGFVARARQMCWDAPVEELKHLLATQPDRFRR